MDRIADLGRCKASGEKLSKATLHATLAHLKRFFQWLAGQPGYKSRLQYSDPDYFNLSEQVQQVFRPHIIQHVRFWDKPKALGMLLTHFGLLRERAHCNGEADLVARLEAGRKRAEGAKSPMKGDGTGVADQR